MPVDRKNLRFVQGTDGIPKSFGLTPDTYKFWAGDVASLVVTAAQIEEDMQRAHFRALYGACCVLVEDPPEDPA